MSGPTPILLMTTFLRAICFAKVTVAKMGGWKDAATLVRTYAHAMGDRTVTNVLFDTKLTQDAYEKAASA